MNIQAANCYAFSFAELPIYTKATGEHSVEFYDPWPWLLKYDGRDLHDDLKKLIIAGALISFLPLFAAPPLMAGRAAIFLFFYSRP